MSFELYIALRHLIARKKQTLITVSGVAIGVIVLTVVLSLANGFNQDLIDKTLGATPHIEVLPIRQVVLEDYEVMRERILEIEGVVAASPYIMEDTLFSYGSRTVGAAIRGIVPEQERYVTSLDEIIVEGDIDSMSLNSAFLGEELALFLGVDKGDIIIAASSFGQIAELRIDGLFKSGNYLVDSRVALVSLAAAQQLYGYGEGVSGIAVRVRNPENVAPIATEISVRTRLWARTWQDTNRNLLAALALEKNVMFIVVFLTVVVAAIGMANALVMRVMEKSQEIGILKAMGATRRSISLIFLWQGFITSTIGCAVGVTGGYLLCVLLSQYQFIKLPTDVYYIDSLPVLMEFSDFAYVVIFALIVSIVASIFPARRAARFDPVEILRYG